jgi:chromosome segregation ATPase
MDNENVQNSYNEKLALNKKLYTDNNNLFRNLETRNSEIVALREQIADLEDMNEKLLAERNSLEKSNNNLNDVKNGQKQAMDRLEQEVDKLNTILGKQENHIKNLDAEKLQIISKNDDLNFELKNLHGKLKAKEENLSFTSRQLEEANKTITKLEVKL